MKRWLILIPYACVTRRSHYSVWNNVSRNLRIYGRFNQFFFKHLTHKSNVYRAVHSALPVPASLVGVKW